MLVEIKLLLVQNRASDGDRQMFCCKEGQLSLNSNFGNVITRFTRGITFARIGIRNSSSGEQSCAIFYRYVAVERISVTKR